MHLILRGRKRIVHKKTDDVGRADDIKKWWRRDGRRRTFSDARINQKRLLDQSFLIVTNSWCRRSVKMLIDQRQKHDALKSTSTRFPLKMNFYEFKSAVNAISERDYRSFVVRHPGIIYLFIIFINFFLLSTNKMQLVKQFQWCLWKEALWRLQDVSKSRRLGSGAIRRERQQTNEWLGR